MVESREIIFFLPIVSAEDYVSGIFKTCLIGQLLERDFYESVGPIKSDLENKWFYDVLKIF